MILSPGKKKNQQKNLPLPKNICNKNRAENSHLHQNKITLFVRFFSSSVYNFQRHISIETLNETEKKEEQEKNSHTVRTIVGSNNNKLEKNA